MAIATNMRVYDAHVIERYIIEFAPSRLPQKEFAYHSGKRDGVMRADVMCHFKKDRQ